MTGPQNVNMSARIQLCIDGQPTRREVARLGRLQRLLWPWARAGRGQAGVICGSWLRPARWVHTFGARGPVDVVFLRADGVVLEVASRVAPWKLLSCRQATSALRLRPGAARRLGLQPGMALDLMS